MSGGSPRVTVRLPEAGMLERLRAAAEAQGRTVSDLVRGAVGDQPQVVEPQADPAGGDTPEAVTR